MRIIDPKALAATAAERWKYGYCTGRARGDWYSEDKRKIHEKLLALGSSPDPKDIDRIIGNRSWTREICNEVDCNEDACIEIGQPPDYDSMTAKLCRSCLRKAAALAGLL